MTKILKLSVKNSKRVFVLKIAIHVAYPKVVSDNRKAIEMDSLNTVTLAPFAQEGINKGSRAERNRKKYVLRVNLLKQKV